jgi:hypothetical protein
MFTLSSIVGLFFLTDHAGSRFPVPFFPATFSAVHFQSATLYDPAVSRVTAKSETIQKPPNFQDGYGQISPVGVKSILWTETEQSQTISSTGVLTSKT